ncbi:hypothetical protein L1987_77106 [Smallanthus sonchifolius]|uniref:Uncharacterized protein n=1 Tax=Smallanthus sonchifolius TaxID=185202 RepID=A0ACB8Z8V7_9ASTR|nr:hypothetical protein L1987_77106 [Smallanthus sonchifolius]
MAGKVVLITGASSGLGELMAYEYAKLGAYLAIIATRKSESRLKQVAERARELGSPDVLFMFADVSKIDECRMFVDETIQRFGRLDHLVCNAGIGPLNSINNDVTKFVPVMDLRDAVPTMEAEPCVKAVVDGIRKGATSITEPRFFNTLILIKLIFPRLHYMFFNSFSPLVEN